MKDGKILFDFKKIFNNMYKNILIEIKPSETYTKLTFANYFKAKF